MYNQKQEKLRNTNKLKEINLQFYYLIKNLSNKRFDETSQIAKIAYECYMEELSKKLNDKI